MVLINDGADPREIRLTGDFSAYATVAVYETSESRDLEKTAERAADILFTLAPRSVTTLVFSD